MKILEQAFSKIKPVRKNTYNFFIKLIEGLIGTMGKRTFRNMARFMQIDEHTFSRQMAKPLDFLGINTKLILAFKSKNDVLIAAQDASFVHKSGKETYGIDYHWSGTAGRAEKGLEVNLIAVVKVNGKKEGYSLLVDQTPPNPLSKAERKNKKTTDFSKIDFCVEQVKKTLTALFALGIKYMAVDGFFAKVKYVNGLVDLGLHVISKLRKDARLRRNYIGPQKARGRKKKFDIEKIENHDFKDLLVVKMDQETVELKSCIAHSVSLNRLIKVVSVHKIEVGKIGKALLFSTDIEQDMLQIYEFYTSRYQIEFIFRDSKGFTGFEDCQSSNKNRLHYHFNTSLIALNVTKIQDAEMQKTKGVQHPFSMTNWARKYNVDIVINRFISMFGLNQTLIKLDPRYESFLGFTNVTH